MEEASPTAVLENPSGIDSIGARMIKCGSTTGGIASTVLPVSEENVQLDLARGERFTLKHSDRRAQGNVAMQTGLEAWVSTSCTLLLLSAWLMVHRTG